jgi:hypothetical protein
MKELDNNRIDAEFNDINPPDGHFERFIIKLDTALHSNRKLLKFQAYAIAASVVVVIVLSIILFIKVEQFRQQPSLLTGISPELEEAELYYQSRIQERMHVLEVNKLVDEQVINDLNEIDKSFKFINKDLKKNPGDERIIQAVMQIYQLKLDMINDLLLQLK